MQDIGNITAANDISVKLGKFVLEILFIRRNIVITNTFKIIFSLLLLFFLNIRMLLYDKNNYNYSM